MAKSTFYHAGCPVCVDAERMIVEFLDPNKVQVEVVHLGDEQSRIAEAERVGVKSVPALVIDQNVYHLNFGASLEDVKQ